LPDEKTTQPAGDTLVLASLEAKPASRAKGARRRDFTPLAVHGERRGRQAAFSSFAGVAQRLLQIAGTLVVMPMVLHAVGSEGFGVWAAAASFFWMTVVVDFGVGQALLTTVAQNVARGDIAEIRRQIGAALLVSLVLSLVGSILAAAIIPRIASPGVADAYLIAAVLLSINIPLSLTANVWTGLQRFHMTSAWETFQTIVTVCGLFVLTRFSTDARYYVAVTAGGLLVANVASTISLYSRHPELLPSLQLPSASRCLALMQRGAPFFILSVAATLAINLDSVIALSRLGADAASRMAVAQRACLTALGLLWVVTQPLWPAVTDAATRGDHAWVRKGILGGAIVVTLCALSGGAILILFGQPLLDLWMGGGMKLGQDVPWAMAAWVAMLSLGRIVDVLLNGLGAVWFQARVAIIYSALAFLLKFLLAPHFGVAGILASTVIAYGLTYAPAYIWWLTRWLRDANPRAA
jgi:O-antigen/teichoic acid export membrane protein